MGKYKFSRVFELERGKIVLRPELFQGRKVDFAQETVDKILAEGYDKSQEPIVVWKDESGNYILLSGHSRFEAAKRLVAAGEHSLATLPVKEFKGTQEEAIDYAVLESNRSGTEEGLLSDLEAYRRAKSQGRNREYLSRFFKPKGRLRKLESLSYLDPKGQLLRFLAGDESQHFPYLERNAKWVGQIRKQEPRLTDFHEGEMFGFLYPTDSSDTRRLKITKDVFFDRVNKKVGRIDFDPVKPLNLKETVSTSTLTSPIQKQIDDLEKELERYNKQRSQSEEKVLEYRGQGKNDLAKKHRDKIREISQLILRVIEEKTELQRQILKMEVETTNDLFTQTTNQTEPIVKDKPKPKMEVVTEQGQNPAPPIIASKQQIETVVPPARPSAKSRQQHAISVIPTEIPLIRRFLSLDQKPVTYKRVLSVLIAVQKAIRKGLVRKTRNPTPYWKEIEFIQSRLVKAINEGFNTANPDAVQTFIFKPEMVQKLTFLSDNFNVRHSVRLMNRFISLMGKAADKGKAAKLLADVKKATTFTPPIVRKNDPHVHALNTVVEVLEEYLDGRSNRIEAYAQTLTGLPRLTLNDLPTAPRPDDEPTPRDVDLEETHRTETSYLIPPPKGEAATFKSTELPHDAESGEEFSGRWADLLNSPAKGFSAMVYGQPKSGKSTLIMDLSGYLAANKGPVLYASIEEGHRGTIRERIDRLGVAHPNLVIKNYLPADLSPFRYVVIDSVSRGHVDIDMMRQLLEHWPDISFLFIFHVTNAGLPRGGASFRHEVDILVEVKDGKAFATGRFGPGETFVRFE